MERNMTPIRKIIIMVACTSLKYNSMYHNIRSQLHNTQTHKNLAIALMRNILVLARVLIAALIQAHVMFSGALLSMLLVP